LLCPIIIVIIIFHLSFQLNFSITLTGSSFTFWLKCAAVQSVFQQILSNPYYK